MIFLTVKNKAKPAQISWEDILRNKDPINIYLGETDRASTTTYRLEDDDEKVKQYRQMCSPERMIEELKSFNNLYGKLINENLNQYYRHFKIPKATGGWRDIDAPEEPLKSAQTIVASMLTEFGGLNHTSAFAYVKNRCTKDAVEKHQRMKSKWFLHTDFSGFFPNTRHDFVMHMLSMIFPFSEIIKDEEGKEELRKALSIAYYNGGLVQGSTLSPSLTNLIFIPIDYSLNKYCESHKLVYTRYADDIYVSGIERFPWQKVVEDMKAILKEYDAVYEIKPEKTHFGSIAGNNWMLGLMLNKDHNITIGYKNKKFFKAELANFILDTINNKPWSIEDVMHLQGKISYYKMIEKEYFDEIIERYNKKWNVNVKEMIGKYLRG